MKPAPYLLSWLSGLASHKCRCPSMMNSSSPPSVLNTASLPVVRTPAAWRTPPRQGRLGMQWGHGAGSRHQCDPPVRRIPRGGTCRWKGVRHRLPPEVPIGRRLTARTACVCSASAQCAAPRLLTRSGGAGCDADHRRRRRLRARQSPRSRGPDLVEVNPAANRSDGAAWGGANTQTPPAAIEMVNEGGENFCADPKEHDCLHRGPLRNGS